MHTYKLAQESETSQNIFHVTHTHTHTLKENTYQRQITIRKFIAITHTKSIWLGTFI